MTKTTVIAVKFNQDWIRENVINSHGKINPRSSSLSWWRNKDAMDIWNDVCIRTSHLSQDARYTERIYAYLAGLTSVPTCKTCQKNLVKFCSGKKQYQTYCSNHCQSQDPATQKKKKATCYTRYGEQKNFSSEKHREKTQQTVMEKYGVTKSVISLI